MVKNSPSNADNAGSIPGRGCRRATKLAHATKKNPCAATKTRYSQKKKKKRSVSHEESKHGPALREPVSGGPTRHSLPSYSPIIFPSCPPMSGQGKKILVGQPTSPTFSSPAAPLPLPSKGLHSSYSPSRKVTPPAPCAG